MMIAPTGIVLNTRWLSAWISSLWDRFYLKRYPQVLAARLKNADDEQRATQLEALIERLFP